MNKMTYNFNEMNQPQNFKAEAKTDKEVRDILKANGINPKIKRG